MATLFVYGTLCFPEIVEKLTGKSFPSGQALLQGFQRKKVKNADYPAIIENINSNVEGMVLYNVDDRSMQIFSFYEGVDYKCMEQMVNLKKDKIMAKVFVWNSDFEKLEDGDWSLEVFQNNSVRLYLEKVIPDTMLDFLKLNH